MSGQWAGSTRRSRLPANWSALRAATAERASYRCQGLWLDGTRCDSPGAECDHVIPNDDHSPSNLQWLCAWHHKAKTNREAYLARPKLTNKHPRHQ